MFTTNDSARSLLPRALHAWPLRMLAIRWTAAVSAAAAAASGPNLLAKSALDLNCMFEANVQDARLLAKSLPIQPRTSQVLTK